MMVTSLPEARTSQEAGFEDERGFGLAELLVYMVLSVLVLTISGSLMISALTARTQVSDLTSAAGSGQLIATSVEEGVRNASGALGTTDSGIEAGVETAAGQLLRARVAVGTNTGSIVWRCQAWFYSVDTNSVYSAVDDAAAIEDPISFSESGGVHTPAAGSAHWTLLGEGVGKLDLGTSVFGAGDNQVVLRFKMSRDGVDLVHIPSTVVKRKLAAGGTGPTSCY